jgi:hypothetical protein
MKAAGIDVLLLTKPSNMFYLTGDGRLCAYAMITQKGKVALGVPQTDVKDVKSLAYFNYLVGFEDEVGMIHSIAHYFEDFGIQKGTLGLEHTLCRYFCCKAAPRLSRRKNRRTYVLKISQFGDN